LASFPASRLVHTLARHAHGIATRLACITDLGIIEGAAIAEVE
jgi:hypothetical protein